MSVQSYSAVLAACVLAAAVVSIGPVQFEIGRSAVDGGGVMRSVGGDFELSGTIAQPDAGVMAGGDIEIYGGFWHAALPMDCNEDGWVGLPDHDDFTSCLGGPNAGVGAGCGCFDVDRNGNVDLFDFAVAQITFTG